MHKLPLGVLRGSDLGESTLMHSASHPLSVLSMAPALELGLQLSIQAHVGTSAWTQQLKHGTLKRDQSAQVTLDLLPGGCLMWHLFLGNLGISAYHFGN